MLPVIALVGRPNVGKSTLFNRLTRSRDALVADFPGLTRDRQYGQGRVGERPYLVIDTGGITGDEEGLDAEMARHSLQAINEADIVLFLVDARSGVTPADQLIARYLREHNKTAHLVVNKTDGLDAASWSAEFYELAMGQPYLIAASQNRGITSMMTELLPSLSDAPETSEPAPIEVDEVSPEAADATLAEQSRQQSDRPLRFGIIGRPNVGKSTLVNRILGEERVIVYDQPGTTRDAITIPFERNGKPFVLVDTAGIRRRKNITEVAEKFSIVKTLQAIKDCQVAVLVIDARTGLVEQDLHLLSFVLEEGRALVLAVNKWDNLDAELKDKIRSQVKERLGFVDYADLHFISALHGTGVGDVFRSVEKAYRAAISHWSTNRLTTLLQDVVSEHAPPMVNGRRIKLRYAHQGGMNPPIIVVHGNQTHALPDSYKRYLMNTFRRVLKVSGTPLRFEFRSGDNPYAPEAKTSREQAKARQLQLTKSSREARRRKRR